MVKFLVEAGADVNVKNNKGKTALHLAEAKGQSSVTALLEQYGAK